MAFVSVISLGFRFVRQRFRNGVIVIMKFFQLFRMEILVLINSFDCVSTLDIFLLRDIFQLVSFLRTVDQISNSGRQRILPTRQILDNSRAIHSVAAEIHDNPEFGRSSFGLLFCYFVFFLSFDLRVDGCLLFWFLWFISSFFSTLLTYQFLFISSFFSTLLTYRFGY